MTHEIRWAFNASTWRPCQQQLRTALSGISSVEMERIQKFHFRDDFKLSLAGRLMIRKCIRKLIGIPWKEIELSRTPKGKPVLVNEGCHDKVYFNVSHAGDYTVLAASTKTNIGCDVMKFVYPNNCDVSNYFKLMRRQFVDAEWDFITSFESDWTQLKAFYRLWCLKESYLKAVGTGIGTESAETIRFQIKTKTLEVSSKEMCNDSLLFVTNKVAPWKFYETMLDDDHIVATACEEVDDENDQVQKEFEILTFDDLAEDIATVVPPSEEGWWETYQKKKEKNK